MKPTTLLMCFLAIIGLMALPGCQGYRDTVRGMNHSLGAIEPRDLDQADAYQQQLPAHLHLDPQQIKVEPGSGVTHVTLTGIDSDFDRHRISTELARLNSLNPQLNPLVWSYDD
jgi:hypothetical protein